MDLKSIKNDLHIGIKECRDRGLHHTVKWFAELNYSLRNIQVSQEDINSRLRNNYIEETELYLLAKSYFDLKEYDRCSHFLKNCTTNKAKFLKYYAKYLSLEKKKLDNISDPNFSADYAKNLDAIELYNQIKADYYENTLDGYCLYLYATILKKLDQTQLAIDTLVESINKEPLLWCSWLELALLLPNKTKLDHLKLPDIWVKDFFMAHAHLEQLNNNEALSAYANLHSAGFGESSYVIAQTAIAYHNRRDLDQAIGTFQLLLEIDPYRLDNLDTYSNLLYVKEMKSELATLAHKAVTIDKYRVETCCIVGNFYSLRSDHAKAVLYFLRALKLNPHYLSAWTLMGHEYMEMKNTNAAIQSYRKAIDINRRDYRAWYGLGQTYEILKMPYYCLYYYKEAQQLRPNDSRMTIALGETYEKLDKVENALKCYYKACRIGTDIEGIALIKLAKLYEKLNMLETAAAAYADFCARCEQDTNNILGTNVPENVSNLGESSHVGTNALVTSANGTNPGTCITPEEQGEYYAALLYLANYHLKSGQLDNANNCAYKCLEHDDVKEQAKALLKAIAAKRAENAKLDSNQMGNTPNAPLGEIQELSSNLSADSSLIVEIEDEDMNITNIDVADSEFN